MVTLGYRLAFSKTFTKIKMGHSFDCVECTWTQSRPVRTGTLISMPRERRDSATLYAHLEPLQQLFEGSTGSLVAGWCMITFLSLSSLQYTNIFMWQIKFPRPHPILLLFKKIPISFVGNFFPSWTCMRNIPHHVKQPSINQSINLQKRLVNIFSFARSIGKENFLVETGMDF